MRQPPPSMRRPRNTAERWAICIVVALSLIEVEEARKVRTGDGAAAEPNLSVPMTA
jgi:hypothetical protein